MASRNLPIESPSQQPQQMQPQMQTPQMQTPQVVYPEVFYKLQPYIIMVCDQMDTYGTLMPTQEMIEEITDNIYEDICRMFPDLADYIKTSDSPQAQPVQGPFGTGMFRRGFRRRGIVRDLIDILLLSEFYRRRRRPYY